MEKSQKTTQKYQRSQDCYEQLHANKMGNVEKMGPEETEERKTHDLGINSA